MIKYSVIIPTLNQSTKLKQCLFHLSELFFNTDLFEILVVDNGSTDDTKEVSLLFQDKIKNLRYLFCKSPGLMAARHMGCDMAKGEILCYIDDDSLVTKNWLKGISESFTDEDVMIVGGPCIPKYEKEPPHWVEYFWSETEYGRYNTFLSLLNFGSSSLFMSPMYVFGCNFSIRKKIFLEYDGTYPDYFDERYRQFQGNGESGLSLKLYNAGYLAMYNPLAKIDHLIPNTRLTIDYFCWKRYYNGIHNSYQAIRQMHGLGKPMNIDNKSSNVKKGLKCIQNKLVNIRQFVKDVILPGEPREIVKLRKKIEKSYREGFVYHQREVQKDPKLHEWVLRKNYLGDNGELPE